MRKPIAFLTLLLTLSVPVLPSAHAAVTYRAGEGWSSDEEDSGAAESTASAQFRKAEDLESHGERKKAVGAYKVLLKQWPKSGVAPVAQLRLGDLYVSLGDSERGFEAYGKYIKQYPSGQEFEQAVEGQFNVAVSFMEGERRKVFGVKTFPSMSRAQEMFAEIVKSAPYSKWAALSQYNIGRCMEKQGKPTDAIAAYQNTVDQYPADEIAADAQYQIGYIYMSLVRDGSNDQGSRNRAREAFEDFTLRFPKSEKVTQAEENIRFLGGVDVKKTLSVAEFYEKTANYKAAVIYYDEVISLAPGTDEANTARKRLDRLKETVGEDKLRAGPERAETGERAKERRKMQSLVDTAARSDYAGPPAPSVPEEQPEGKPQLRTPGGAESPLPVEGLEEGASSNLGSAE